MSSGMRSYCAGLLLAAAVLVTGAEGQQTGGGSVPRAAAPPTRGGFDMTTGRSPQGIVGVAGIQCVQKEIQLDGENSTKADKLAAEFEQERRTELEKIGFGRNFMRDLAMKTPEERAARLREYRDKSNDLLLQLVEKYDSKLRDLLTPNQYKRVNQIAWQAAGSRALVDVDLRQVLRLTVGQQDAIAEINRESEQAVAIRRRPIAPNETPKLVALLREVNRERNAKALEKLTAGQRKQYADLLGPEFDLLARLFPETPAAPDAGPGARRDKSEQSPKKE